MGKKYIIELLDDCPSEFKGIMVFGLTQEKQISVELIPEESLRPYTEPDMEQVREEAYEDGYKTAKVQCNIQAEKDLREVGERHYQKGLSDAWEAARKVTQVRKYGGYGDCLGDVFGRTDTSWDVFDYSAPEAIEKIRQYEQEKEEQEEKDSVTAEDVMRQYLDMFCKGRSCTGCVLNEHDFTCGRGRHFLTSSPVSNEEVRRAYTTVLQKMRETNDNK